MPDIVKGVRAFTIGTAISRVLGLVRESVFAYLFGAGTSTDAFNAAFRIPNLLRDLFAETSLSAAFVPVLTAEKQKSKEAQNLLASNVLNFLIIIVGVIVIAGIILAPYIVRVIALGFGAIPAKLALTSYLTTIMFPFLLFISLAAWAMGCLNTEREFLVPSLSPALFNVLSIAVPIILYAYLLNNGIDPILGMAIGVVLGGAMQFIFQTPILYRKGFRYRPYLNLHDPQFKKVVVLFIPVAIGLAASRINVAVDTILISLLEERSMTWLNYAFRIMHLPLGLFGIAVGTVALPTFAQFVAEKNNAAVKSTFIDSLKLVFFLTVSSAVIIAFLSHPITKIIYERGKFTPFDTNATTQALILYIIGIPFMAALRNVAAVFYAYKDSRTPMLASFAAVFVNIVLNLTLMRIIGFRAFPLATTLSSLINIIILIYLLPGKVGELPFAELGRYYFLLVIAAGFGGIVSFGLHRLLITLLGSSFLVQAGALLVSGFLAFLLFYGGCLAMRIPEARNYLRRLLRR